MMNYIKRLFGQSNDEFIEVIRDSESIHEERMANMVEWVKALRVIRREGFSITNPDTQDTIDLVSSRDETGTIHAIMYRPITYKVVFNKKPVFELIANTLSLYVDSVNRFNYGSWYHDVEELYTKQMDMAECTRQAKHDALFAPLDE